VGSLDEHNQSLWADNGPTKTYRSLNEKGSFDAIVIGGGITGLTTAYLLKQEGMKVAVLEAGRIASGVTGYTTAKVTALHGLIYDELSSRNGADRASAYGAANLWGVARIANIVEQLGMECDLERLDAYTYADSDDAAESVRREVAACADADVPVELATSTPLPFSVRAAVVMRNQYMFHPRKYCAGLAEGIAGNGSRIYEHTRVAEVEELKTLCHVKTDDKVTLSTPFVVAATHMPFMGDGNFFAKEYPYRAYVIAARAKDGAPDGMFISADEPVRSVRPYRSDDERWLIIGGESHKVGQEPEPGDHYEALESWARERFDGLGPVEYRWSAQDYMTMDGMPYVGRITPSHERIFVATGYRKWGLTNGTAAARIITDAIAGRPNDWAGAFDSTRKRPVASAKEFAKENVNVARHLVLDKLRTPDEGLADIPRGEGVVLEVAGETLAVYRDDDGELTALSPDCTHMGCRVAFNKAERSWDCPCHGSRFGTDGRVLEGPANQDLERKEIEAAAGEKRR